MSRSAWKFLNHSRRFFGATSSPITYLSNRVIIEVTGSDGLKFLQGLTTANVMNPALNLVQYSMFLNAQGRVLYDVILYHVGQDRLWVESDMGAAEDIFKHFKKYVLRSKVEFRLLNDVHVHNKPPDNATSHDIKYIIDTPDPRTSSIGSRVLAASIIGSTSSNDDCHYHMMRMDQGVLEGITELPPGQCLPLEVNLDYMNGVSFSKGCYLGQELTSRTHHTGVVRKRVLPLKLSQSPSNFIWGTPVHSLSGKPLGKVFSCYGRSAVALLRMPNLNEGENVNILCSDESIISAQWKKPDWWPDEK